MTWNRSAAAGLLAVVDRAGCGTGSSSQQVAAGSASHAGHGTEPSRAPRVPAHRHRRQPFDFSAETADAPTLVHFGDTNCPDECLTAMADIAAALRKTPADVPEEVEVILLTTEPAGHGQAAAGVAGPVRQRLPRPDRHAGRHRRRSVGSTQAAKAGPSPTLPGPPNERHKPGTAPNTHSGPLGYGVNHASLLFAYSTDDTLPVVYTAGVTPSDIAGDLPALAAAGTS